MDEIIFRIGIKTRGYTDQCDEKLKGARAAGKAPDLQIEAVLISGATSLTLEPSGALCEAIALGASGG